MSQPQIMANMGRPQIVREPPGVEHLHPDLPTTLQVYLAVWGEECGLPARDRHWAICWKVGVASNGDPVYRMLQVVQERGPFGPLYHLTNWGPKTKIAGPSTLSAKFLPLGQFTYQQRQWLENLARTEPVLVPNGWWNCQYWVVSILVRCIQGNMLRRRVVQDLLAEAGWTAPLLI